MNIGRLTAFILAAFAVLAAPSAHAIRTPIDTTPAAISEPLVAVAEPAPADAWFIEAVYPIGQADDGDFIDLAVLVEPQTHTRVWCYVKSPLGLAPTTIEKVEINLMTGEQVVTYEPEIDARYKDYNALTRYSVPRLPPGNYSLIEDPWLEFRQIGEGRLSFGFFPSLKPKIQVGPIKGEVGLGYENSIDAQIYWRLLQGDNV